MPKQDAGAVMNSMFWSCTDFTAFDGILVSTKDLLKESHRAPWSQPGLSFENVPEQAQAPLRQHSRLSSFRVYKWSIRASFILELYSSDILPQAVKTLTRPLNNNSILLCYSFRTWSCIASLDFVNFKLLLCCPYTCVKTDSLERLRVHLWQPQIKS